MKRMVGDSDAEGDRGRLFAEAGKIQKEVKAEYDILVKEKENIEHEANKLLEKPQLKEATSKILNEMKDEIEKIHKANKEGALLGINNPVVQF